MARWNEFMAWMLGGPLMEPIRPAAPPVAPLPAPPAPTPPAPPAPPPAPAAAALPASLQHAGPAVFSPRDELRLVGVHPDLVRVVRRARLTAAFTVIEGLRTRERQAQLVVEGHSQTLNSRHLTGHAVDLGPVPLDWHDKRAFIALADVMLAAAQAERVPVKWGGSFTAFFDGPHFELSRVVYP
jgi:peptidoglycan L-alanyl-D-glutamate endopeptidase CwlK